MSQFWSTSSPAISVAPPLIAGLLSSHSLVDSPSSASPLSLQLRLVDSTVLVSRYPSLSASTKHSSFVSQFWSTSSPAISPAAGLIAALPSLQSLVGSPSSASPLSLQLRLVDSTSLVSR